MSLNYKVRCSRCKRAFVPGNGLQMKCSDCRGLESINPNTDSDIMKEIAKDIMPDVFVGKVEIGER